MARKSRRPLDAVSSSVKLASGEPSSLLRRGLAPVLRQYAVRGTFEPSFEVSPYLPLTIAFAALRPPLWPRKKIRKNRKVPPSHSVFGHTPNDCAAPISKPLMPRRHRQTGQSSGRLYPVAELRMRGRVGRHRSYRLTVMIRFISWPTILGRSAVRGESLTMTPRI